MVQPIENARPRIPRPEANRPVNFPWLAVAAKLPGRTLNVAMAIWFVASLHKTPTIRLAPYVLRMFGVSRDCCYDSLRRLSDAGLIALKTQRGRLPVMTLVDEEVTPLSLSNPGR